VVPCDREAALSYVRLIHVSVPPDEAGTAERNWKESCAPLMIRQPGCVSEKLLRCADAPGEYISYSEWNSLEDIDAYLRSPAHEEIKRHNRNIHGAKVTVKTYSLV